VTKLNRRILLLVLCGAGLRPATAASLPPWKFTAIDHLFAAEFAKEPVGGATIGIVLEGRLAWSKSYGLADIEANLPPNDATVYRIGSISKQFAAIALLQLARNGKLHLSDPVEKFFPEINKISGKWAGAAPITLLQLATHTAGLSREPEPIERFTHGSEAQWEDTVIKALPTVRYQYEPGTRYSYSNIGYAILGAAIGRAAGQPYTDYVRKNILAPLEMTSTGFTASPGMRERLAKGYTVHNGAPDSSGSHRELVEGRGYKVPNGALFTTITDLAKFVAFETGAGPEDVLPRQALLDNFSRVSTATGDLSSGYGIGFQVIRRGNLVAVGHGGSVAGYTAGAYILSAAKIGIIFLRNSGRGFPSDVVLKALEELQQ
jgi:CubicO group peptidase (beta-lactamase class C family)